MPQMAPMMWEVLFIMFIMTFLLMNIFNYYLKKKVIKNSQSIKDKKNQMNWSW
uniref:ATP synthase F0 subunit 8 n=1 Tax=Gonopsimorpha nigrosignata TaxID=3021792 RepID=UPI0023AAC646|nr:ATP synthase F0 subunit 8 [Gonopsimorpha nigrosignata]WCB99305.1 ATP synthase F0 subunit 8 [Gonopsimorpha nigrosignata]